MAFIRFEDLQVRRPRWRLAAEIFQSFQDCRFPRLRNRSERAALSLASNVAGGGGRGFGQFLKTKGSSGELGTQLPIARTLRRGESQAARALIRGSREISAMLEGPRISVTGIAREQAAFNLILPT